MVSVAYNHFRGQWPHNWRFLVAVRSLHVLHKNKTQNCLLCHPASFPMIPGFSPLEGGWLLEVNRFLWHHLSFRATQEKWSVRAEAVLRGPLGSLQSHWTLQSFKTQTSKYLDGIQSFPLPCDLFPEKNQIVGKRENHLNWAANSQNCYWSLLQKGGSLEAGVFKYFPESW